MSGGGVKKLATTVEHSPPQFHSSGTHVLLFAHRRAFVILERALPRQISKTPARAIVPENGNVEGCVLENNTS